MAIKVGIGLSREKDPVKAAGEAIEKAKINLRQENVSLAFVFATTELSCASLLKTISASLPGVPVIGCSGAAVISNQGIFQHGVAIMLLGLTEGIYFNTARVEDVSSSPFLSGEKLGENLLYAFKDIRRDLGVLFCDGLMRESHNIIRGLQEKLGKSFPLLGASASDNLRFFKTYVYFNQEARSNAACGIIWGGKINFGLGIKHGWRPLGKPRYVTKSKDNIVYEIDSLPAAKLYEEYLASNLGELKKELSHISRLYPIGVYLSGEEEYLLRNIVSIEDDGSLVLQGDVPEKSQIRLMIGTKDSCLAATYQAVEAVKKDLAGKAVDFVFIFESVSRYLLLRRQANKELEIIKEGLGRNTPLIGIYTYGEQGPLNAIDYRGMVYSHNQTITLLGMGG